MIKVLIKKQLYEIFRGYFYDSKKNKARSVVSNRFSFILAVCWTYGRRFRRHLYLSVHQPVRRLRCS